LDAENIEEAMQIFETRVGYLHQESEDIEIDVESDSALSKEESKFEFSEKEEEFSTMPTKILFKKAHLILNIIQERMMAKEESLRNRLSIALRDPKVAQ
jgi:hypothetical protein